MSKDKISDYSATANSNTDIAGINIDEGCAPSGINDAIRTLMKQLKDFQQGTNGDSFNGPVNGTIGATTPAAGTFTTLTASGNVVLGDASTDTLNVGNGGLIKDSSGNLGLGVTPSAWASGWKAFQMPNGASLGAHPTLPLTYLNSNSYFNGTSNIYIANGYASRFVADGNSGGFVWQTAGSGTAGNPITFTSAMTLDASGNLGVGTTSPSVRLHVAYSGATATFSRFSNSAGNTYLGTNADGSSELSAADANGYLKFMTGGGSERVRISSSGGLSIGTTNDPGAGNINLPDGKFIGWGGLGTLIYGDSTNNYMYFRTNGAEKARIDSSGNLLVGQTSYSTSANGIAISAVGTEGTNTPRLSVSGAATTNSSTGLSMYSTGASANRFYVGWGGTIFATSTTISAISDQRFKKNIRDLDVGLDAVMALKPRLYDWKEGKGANIKNARGFIAQEFEQVFPDLIDEWRDPAPEGEEPYKSVRQDLIPVLVKAIQEQQSIIQQLQADVASLKG